MTIFARKFFENHASDKRIRNKFFLEIDENRNAFLTENFFDWLWKFETANFQIETINTETKRNFATHSDLSVETTNLEWHLKVWSDIWCHF